CTCPSRSDHELIIITYKILQNRTLRRKPILVDNRGYKYTKRWQRNPSSIKCTWVCSVRGKCQRCPVSVLQHGDVFQPGSSAQHSHPADSDAAVAVEFASAVKAKSKQDVFRSAGAIVEEVMTSLAPDVQPASFPKLANLVLVANRTRQALRPHEPTDLKFPLATDFVPANFLVKDVIIGVERHLLFMSPEQTTILDQAKTWYLDGTFKVVHKPFYPTPEYPCLCQLGARAAEASSPGIVSDVSPHQGLPQSSSGCEEESALKR
ncbi:uncharacterized protein LOC110986074, partial [Acanthaster planci]|uniref:Uncharacterized protein LOC110986074 n=1 Tax=Acanthaster planci TaxID=133434 RepID=A0A8B7ZEU6_ACAPL